MTWILGKSEKRLNQEKWHEFRVSLKKTDFKINLKDMGILGKAEKDRFNTNTLEFWVICEEGNSEWNM